MFNQLQALTKRPAPYEDYENCVAKLWADDHISKGMLEAHLNPHWDAATRPHTRVQEDVKWINSIAPTEKYPTLLDLGCGPGIYAQLFHKAGYQVTGMDFSRRSIDYAKNSARENSLPITYHYQDYLTLDFKEQFDLITLINYDFGVLSPESRAKLLKKIHAALKPKGLLVFDVFTPHRPDREENSSWKYTDKGNFFSPQPCLCLNSFFLYEEKRTSCRRHLIITEQQIKSIHIWEHTFTKDELTHDLSVAGFVSKDFYGNTTGADYCEDGKEICVIAKK